MARNAEDVQVAGSGGVYVAALDTAFPDFHTEMADAAGWTDLGYFTEDGVNCKIGRETKDIMVWQSFDPVRTIVTKIPKEFTFTLTETGPEQIKLAFGGGTWAVVDDVYTYTAPGADEVDERAMLVEFLDGTTKTRYLIQRSLNKAGTEFDGNKDKEIAYKVTMAVLTPATGEALQIQTNSDAFIGVGS